MTLALYDWRHRFCMQFKRDNAPVLLRVGARLFLRTDMISKAAVIYREKV